MVNLEDSAADRLLSRLSSADDFLKNHLTSPEEFFSGKRKKKQIAIGQGESGTQFFDLDMLRTHLHVVGLTGTGKSFFLELLSRELLYLKKGFCLIDPLGYLYNSVANYIAHHPEYAERVIFFDPTEPSEHMVGYNPLAMSGDRGSLSVHVDEIALSLLHVFETDPAIAQRLDNFLQNALNPTIAAGLTPCELIYFALADTTIRNAILSHTNDAIVHDFWQQFDKSSVRDKKEELGSFYRRIVKFARREMIKATVGQDMHTLDIPEIIESGKVLLVKLSPSDWLGQRDGYVIGTLLVNEMYRYALRRNIRDAKANPFYLLIDEFQHFLTPNASNILETCRQKGLHLVLSHQHLNQLISQHLDPPDSIYQAVMSNARNKVIFSVFYDDAKELAKNFAPHWDPERVKQELYRTAVLDYKLQKLILSGKATGKHEAHSEGSGSGSASGFGSTSMQGQVMSESVITGIQESSASYDSMMSSWNEFSGSSHGFSEITSKGEAMMLHPILGKELASREFWSIDEQHFKTTQKLVDLPTQHAVVLLQDGTTWSGKIRTLVQYPDDTEKTREAHAISSKALSPLYLPYAVRMELYNERVKQLAAGRTQEQIETTTKPASPHDFYFESDESEANK